MDIVVLQKYKMALQIAELAQVNEVLNVTLPVVVTRVGLPREHKLNRLSFIPRQFHDVLELLEDERRSLVGREPSREPNGERVRIQ